MTTLPTERFHQPARGPLRPLIPAVVAALALLLGVWGTASAQEKTTGGAAAPVRPPMEDFTLLPRQAQSPAPPAARQTPARPSKPATPAAPGAPPAAQGPRGLLTPAAQPARPAKVAPPAPGSKVAPPVPPHRVVTVVHRVSGWKLLSLLADSAPPALELDELPSAEDVHTNVVAGFLSDDNRTVVARLPRAEVEVASAGGLSLFSGGFPPSAAAKQSEYTLVLADGRRIPARFVGLDAATGLSMLEAAETVRVAEVIGDAGDTEDPAVGQRVVFYAPVPVAAGSAQRKGGEARPAVPRGTAVGEEGYVYASITSAEGLLTDVMRTPSGRTYAVTAQAVQVNPAWTGAVATDATGSLVGIVSRSEGGQTQIVPAQTLRLAVERVKATRASVPQPWLGARGDSATNAPLDFWVGYGWEVGRAFSLIRDKGGVLLTSVAPGTPAAQAGLRPGDLIAGVGGREVRSVQDFSQMLKEQPIGSAVEFTVLRPPQPEPLRLPVLLSGTQNPALATAEAETRAARQSLLALGTELRLAREEQFRSSLLSPASQARLKEVETKFETAMRAAEEAGRRVFEAQSRAAFAPGLPPPGPGDDLAQRPLLFVGLRAVALSPRGAARLGSKGGFLVVTVEEGSPAAACGLRPGDVIETAGGRGFTRDLFGQLLRDAWAAPVRLGVVRSGQRSDVDFSFSPACAK